MITPPSGIKAVTNAEPFIGGMDAEDDNAFRARLLKSYANISNGTNAAFYRELAMKHPSVYSAGVVAKDDGVGTVSVYVATRGGVPSDEVIEELQNQFDEARELNVAVTVKPAVYKRYRCGFKSSLQSSIRLSRPRKFVCKSLMIILRRCILVVFSVLLNYVGTCWNRVRLSITLHLREKIFQRRKINWL